MFYLIGNQASSRFTLCIHRENIYLKLSGLISILSLSTFQSIDGSDHLAAQTIDDDKDECLKAGMNDFMLKPMRINEISLVIERFTV